MANDTIKIKNSPRKDIMSPEKRSALMSRIKGWDTKIEILVRSELHKRGLRFRKHIKELPGKPDIVFTRAKLVVFIDGDFWHGWQFSKLQERLSPKWGEKIAKNIKRDKLNHDKLIQMGWQVIRIWEHQLKSGFEACINDIVTAYKKKLVNTERASRVFP